MEAKGETLRCLAGLYDEKISLLVEMLRLTTERAGLGEAGQAGEILALIEDRQALMEKIDRLDAEARRIESGFSLPPEGGEMPDGFSGGPITEKQQICLNLVERIMLLDRQQRPRLEKELERLQKQQARLEAGRRALGAYSGKSGQERPEGIFVDEKK